MKTPLKSHQALPKTMGPESGSCKPPMTPMAQKSCLPDPHSRLVSASVSFHPCHPTHEPQGTEPEHRSEPQRTQGNAKREGRIDGHPRAQTWFDRTAPWPCSLWSLRSLRPCNFGGQAQRSHSLGPKAQPSRKQTSSARLGPLFVSSVCFVVKLPRRRRSPSRRPGAGQSLEENARSRLGCVSFFVPSICFCSTSFGFRLCRMRIPP